MGTEDLPGPRGWPPSSLLPRQVAKGALDTVPTAPKLPAALVIPTEAHDISGLWGPE